jgi:micrococcal nuclease
MKTKIVLVIAGLIILATVIWGLIYFIPKIHLPTTIKDSVQTPGFYKITTVVDGDTIEVNMDGTIERVRLIGIDTPETKQPNSPVECYGIAASNFAHQLMDGQSVRLEADPINTNRDRYDRLLRYAYLGDGSLFNAEVIKQGYGFAYLSFPFSKSNEFAQYQTEARDAKRGLWAGECQINNKNGRYKTNDLTYLPSYLLADRLKNPGTTLMALFISVKAP